MFLWGHFRHVNPVKIYPKKLHMLIQSLLMTLIMMALGFRLEKRILSRLKPTTTFALMCFVTKIRWFFNLHFRSKI